MTDSFLTFQACYFQKLKLFLQAQSEIQIPSPASMVAVCAVAKPNKTVSPRRCENSQIYLTASPTTTKQTKMQYAEVNSTATAWKLQDTEEHVHNSRLTLQCHRSINVQATGKIALSFYILTRSVFR
jgi:hypothetical protein